MGEDRIAQRIYRFGTDFELDEGLLELRRGGRSVEIQPKPLFVLLHLVQRRDRVVSRAELMRELWSDVVVSKNSVSSALHEARRALEDSGPDHRLIATVRGLGYRFVGAVEQSGGTAADDEQGTAAVPGATLSAPPNGHQESPFVDRELEMKQLRAALAAASSGERRLVLLKGPPGIGKTRTASELASDAVRAGFEVHVGRGHEGDGAPPFWPWIQLLRSIAEARPGDLSGAAGLAASDIVQLVPELREHLGEPTERGELGPEQARFRMFDGVTGFIRKVARSRPLLLVLDDLHWADEASLALLIFFVRSLSEARLAIVGTHRTADSDPARERALGRVLREPGTESILLAGLASDSVESMLVQTLGHRPAVHVLEHVHAITGGNPFFVAELARLLSTRGREALEGTRPLQVPHRLRDTVRARIAERSELCQRVLRGSSVIGARFALSLLRRAADLSSAELVGALAEAERSDLLYRDSEPGWYRFVHGVVRETLYEGLDAAERGHWHGVIGDALEKLRAPDPTPVLSELAHHFTEAAALDRADRAIHYARRAAASARSVFAHQEQADHCRGALRALEFLEPPDAPLRCELLVELAEALESAHAPSDSVEKAAEQALLLARALGLPTLMARAAQVVARYTLDKDTVAFSDSARAVHLLQRLVPPVEESLAALGDHAHARLRVSGLLVLARMYATTGDLARAAGLVEQAAANLTGDADPTQQCAILGARFEVTDTFEQPAESLAIADGIVETARRANRPDLEVYGHVGRVSLCLQAGDREGADAAGSQIERLAREHAIGDLLILGAIWRGLAAQLDGRTDDVEREAQESVQLSRRFNYQPERAAVLAALQHWWLSLLRGRPATTFAQLRSYTNHQPNLRFPRFLLARLYVELGHRDDAARELTRIDARALAQLPRDHSWLFSACLSAETCALLADAERARDIYALLHPYAERVVTAAYIGVCIGSAARPLGALAAALGMWPECEELFDLALASNAALRAPALVVWTQIDCARALLRAPRPRQRAKGERMLALAARAAPPLGMSDALARARPVP